MAIWVGRYAMIGGEPGEASPWLVDRRRVGTGEPVRLVVLAEPSSEGSEPYCAEIAEAVADLFGRDALSLTGGILRALRQTHANLAEWNRRSLAEHRIAVGVSCVAIRGGEATVALCGPGSAYHGGLDGVERISTEGTPAESPLGGPEPIEPHFRTLPFSAASILLLTSSAESAAGEREVARAVASGPERALGDLYALTRDVSDMSAVLLADLDVAEQDVAALEWTPEDLHRPARPTVDSGMAVLAAPPRREALPAVREPALPVGAGASSGRLPWGLIAGAFAAVIAAALFAGLILLPLLQDDQERRLAELLDQASAGLRSAEEARARGDPASERTAIEETRATLERARAQAEQDPRVDDLFAQLEAARTRLDAVIDVSELARVSTLDGVITAPAQPEALVAGGGSLWLLERGSGRIVRLDPAGEAAPQRVYSPGAEYGSSRARTARAMAWDEARGRLLVIDEGRSLFAIPGAAGSAPRPLLLRGAQDIRSVQAIAAYSGNLYVLDPEGGEIWRYVPAGEGFDSERQGLLGTAEIGTAVALAVDGDVYLLETGALRRFRLGGELPPLFGGIDAFPGAAAGIVADAATGVIYVGDRERLRIVASGRSGDFLRQYRHVDFDDLRGIALAEDGSTLYVLTGRSIYGFDPIAETESLRGQPDGE